MKAASKARIRPVWSTGLLALMIATTGCGPETYHGRFLASWSPDGSRAAAVPNLMEDIPESGIWVFDADSGRSRQILALDDRTYCIHPQWSPFTDEILFATLAKDEEGTKNPADNRMPYSVWIIREDGYGLRKVADSTSSDNSGESVLALPNAVAWGAEPGTVILQSAAGEKVTALLYDPYTGRVAEFLPHPADAYSFEPSPSRRKVAALLYDKSTGTAEVFLSDFGFGNWRSLGTIGFDKEQLDVFSDMIYWSPDSSRFVVPEQERGFALKSKPPHFLRLFDAQTGRSSRIAAGNPDTDILWDDDSRFFAFSETAEGGEDSAIYRVDSRTGWSIPLVSLKGDNYLVSWNRDNGRIYFYNRLACKASGSSEEITVRRFFSCTSNGSDLRDLGPWIKEDSAIWSLSPGGARLILLDPVPRAIDLASHPNLE